MNVKKRKNLFVLETEERQFADSLRNDIHDSLRNLGVLSAFMCALAASLYANPSKTTVCYGDAGYMAVIWLEWFSMGSFFLSISVTVLLSADLSGVPDGLLLRHLQRNQRLHATPMVLTAAGLFLLASGYGVDVDERAGCRLKWLGVVLAPCFPIILVAFAAYLRARRGALNHFGDMPDVTVRFGVRWLTIWADRIPLSTPAEADEKEQKANSRKQSFATDFGFLRDGGATAGSPAVV